MQVIILSQSAKMFEPQGKPFPAAFVLILHQQITRRIYQH